MRAESACGPLGTRRKANARDRQEETGSHRSAVFCQVRKRPRGSAWCQHCRGRRTELVSPPQPRARGPRLTLGQGDLGRGPSASLWVGFCSAASGPEPRLPEESPSQIVRPAPQTPSPHHGKFTHWAQWLQPAWAASAVPRAQSRQGRQGGHPPTPPQGGPPTPRGGPPPPGRSPVTLCTHLSVPGHQAFQTRL